ncbi:MAG: glycosyl transferase, partial [Acidobacteria bacterium]
MIHNALTVFQVVAVLGCACSCIYYSICLWSAARFLRERKVSESTSAVKSFPPISILKPLKGTDPDIFEGFRSHCLQDYPEYEIIFGVS